MFNDKIFSKTFPLGSKVGAYVIIKTMECFIKGLCVSATLDCCIMALLLDIASLLPRDFGNFFNYGILDYLPVVSSIILRGFLRPTKFKIV